jgi:hypothetical protein
VARRRLCHRSTALLNAPRARGTEPALLRAPAHARALALRGAVAGAQRDRVAGVVVESVRVVSRPARLLLHGLELVRDPAGEPVPDTLARASQIDVAGAGALADQIRREPTLRVTARGARVPAHPRVVLT